jgi:hypothetical protein
VEVIDRRAQLHREVRRERLGKLGRIGRVETVAEDAVQHETADGLRG